MAIALSITLFIAVAVAIVVFGYRRYVLAGQVYANLELPGRYKTQLETPSNPDFYSVTRVAEVVARKLPPSPAAASAMRLKLLAAGYREQNAVMVLYGLKIMIMAGITLIMVIFEYNSATGLLMRLVGIGVGILAGFRLPDYYIARRVRFRQKKLRKGLPDALDLIVVCAEAGLTIDRAFKNVAQQLALVHAELCDEFNLFTAEISAGLRRKEALENFAMRTQEPEVRKFIGVVTQADRFGTSMADALRMHAEYLRVRRRQDAEEKASKVSVKLIFPIFFFIMPCMILVTIGPAAIAISKQLIPAFGGGQ
jgi:tight adherence protein C